MALLSKSEVSERFQVPTNQLAVMWKRAVTAQKIMLTGEMLDDQNPLNQAWLTKYSIKGDLKKKRASGGPEKDKISPNYDGNYAATLFEKLEKQKQELQNKEIEGKILKLDLQNKKMQGDFIPTVNATLLTIQLSEAINLSWEAELETMLISLGAEFGISRERMAEIKKEKNVAANNARARAIATCKTMMRRLQAEVGEKKGRGEHG